MPPISDEHGLTTRFQRALSERVYSIERLSAFRNKANWARNTKLARKMNRFLDVHAREYFSPLCPLFLHQIKSLDVISHFSPVLARDGLLSLLWFFKQHPRPTTREALLLVNHKFAAFVPQAWEPVVGYYSLESKHRNLRPLENIKQILLIYSVIDHRQCSLPFVNHRLDRIVDYYSERRQDIPASALFLFNNAFHNHNGIASGSDFHFDLVKSSLQRFGELKAARWPDLESARLTDTVFVDLNEFDFYYSDSHITQVLLGKGAIPFDHVIRDGMLVELSFHHAVRVSFDQPASVTVQRQRVREELRSFLGSELLCERPSAFTEKTAFRNGQKLCPPSFEAFAYLLAQETSGSAILGKLSSSRIQGEVAYAVDRA